MVISKEIVKYSLKNLAHRKTRSFLTILSIFVGIATIFIFISFGAGLYNYIESVTTSSSADKIIVQAKGIGAPGLDDSFQLNDKDLRAVQDTDGVREATGVYFKVAEVYQEDTRKYTFLMGYDPKSPLVLDVFDIDIDKGRMLRKGDEGKAVLGYNYQIKDKIFPKAIGLNEKIEVEGQELRAVGFFESVGNPQDDSQVYVTASFIEELYSKNESYGWIVAKVDIDEMEQTIEGIEKNLRKSRDVEKGKEDFFVQSFEDMVEAYSSALDVVIGFVILIALISVFVSAINTANTMITSVLERTKEIGIIKSIGAKNSEVLRLFLFESAFLGFVAGVIGVLLGGVITYTAGIFLKNLGWGFLQPYYSVSLFAGLVLFAIITGAISGVVPAINASKIKPVDALRYE